MNGNNLNYLKRSLNDPNLIGAKKSRNRRRFTVLYWRRRFKEITEIRKKAKANAVTKLDDLQLER